MQTSELRPQTKYAWSKRPNAVTPSVAKVKFLGSARKGQARIRWEEGEFTGLDEWVPTRELVCAWRDRKAVFRDREHQARLDEDSESLFDRVVEEAISHVLTATGEEGGYLRRWNLHPAKAERLWARAGLDGDPRREPLAFVDRLGELHLGYASALKFAKAFAGEEPQPCLDLVKGYEDEARAEGYLPGGAYHLEYLRRDLPAIALVRQWAGSSEVQLLRKEITRLQDLIGRAQRWLDDAGDERHARQLERALRGS